MIVSKQKWFKPDPMEVAVCRERDRKERERERARLNRQLRTDTELAYIDDVKHGWRSRNKVRELKSTRLLLAKWEVEELLPLNLKWWEDHQRERMAEMRSRTESERLFLIRKRFDERGEIRPGETHSVLTSTAYIAAAGFSVHVSAQEQW